MTAPGAQRAARRLWADVINRMDPTDPWPRVESGDGVVEVDVLLGAELCELVERATRGNRVLLNAVVVTSVASVLATYGGLASVVVGTSAPAGEGHSESALLPLLVATPTTATRRQVLAEVRERLVEAYRAPHCPPSWLLEQFHTRHGEDAGPPVRWSVHDPELHGPLPIELPLDGVVILEKTGALLRLRVRRRAGLGERAATTYLLDRVSAALECLLTDPDGRAHSAGRPGDQPPLDGGPLTPAPPIVNAILEASRRFPKRIALRHGDDVVDYASLESRSGEVAARLGKAAPTGLVAILGPRGTGTVLAMLGALRAGFPYVVPPADVEAGALRGLGVTAVLSSDSLVVDGFDDNGDVTGSPERQIDDAPPDHPAYAVATSGSTGTAKVVLVSHANLAASTHARTAVYGPCTGAFLLLSPFSFDSSVAGTFWALTCGATLEIVPTDELGDPAALVARATAVGATATLGLPRVLEGMARIAGPGGLSDLQVAVGAGEVFSSQLAPLLAEAAPGARLVNEYGPSEASVWATFHDVRDADADDIPIGRPVPGTWLRVLDAAHQPLPPGLPGELAIGGPQVTLGYAGDEALTTQRFVPDPERPAERLHLTRDRVWIDPEGRVRFLGRMDDEVKVRGARIVLSAVDRALRQEPVVMDSVTVVHGEELVSLVVPTAGTSFEPGAVLDRLSARVSRAALPSRLVKVASLPRLSNGKVDPRALRQLAGPDMIGAVRPARDWLETLLLDLFRTALASDDRLGIDSNFFSSGGDSIKAALLVAQLGRTLDTYIYVVALIDHPTVEELATFLRLEYQAAVGENRDGGSAAITGTTPERSDELPVEPFRVAVRPRTAPSEKHLTSAASSRVAGPVFVLAPPRSGSTLLRVLLGGHPQLFSPPELELLQYADVRQRAADLSDGHEYAQEGLVRAVMALTDSTSKSARRLIDRAVDEGWSTREMYRWLTERAGGRTLVDKTTYYALVPEALERAEDIFDRPRYIHLIRDPRSCVASFLEARLDQVYLRTPERLPAQQAAELTWQVAHDNIARWSDTVPADRLHQVAYEDLVNRPEQSARALCDFLGIEYDKSMLKVHADPGDRMTDGLNEGGRMLGDIKFHTHRGISTSSAERWRDGSLDLSAPTLARARELGYTENGLQRRGELAAGQQGLWFLEQLRPGTSTYNVPLIYRGEGTVDLVAMQRALRTLARRHHLLRSVLDSSEPLATLLPNASPTFQVIDVPTAAQRDEALRLALQPFDLARDLLLRLHVLTSPDQFMLILVAHHIVIDAASLQRLTYELFDLYGCWRSGSIPDAPPLTRQALDPRPAGAEHDARRTAAVARAAQRLADPPLLSWPALNPPPPATTGAVAMRIPLPAGTDSALAAFTERVGCTRFAALFAVFTSTVHAWTGERELCVAMPSRLEHADDDTIAMLFNTAVARVTVPGESWMVDELDALVAAQRAALRDALEDSVAPFQEVVATLDLSGVSRSPLGQLIFSFQDEPTTVALEGSRLHRLDVFPEHAKFELAMTVTQGSAGVVANTVFSTDYFDEDTAARFADLFHTIASRLLLAATTSNGPADE